MDLPIIPRSKIVEFYYKEIDTEFGLLFKSKFLEKLVIRLFILLPLTILFIFTLIDLKDYGNVTAVYRYELLMMIGVCMDIINLVNFDVSLEGRVNLHIRSRRQLISYLGGICCVSTFVIISTIFNVVSIITSPFFFTGKIKTEIYSKITDLYIINFVYCCVKFVFLFLLRFTVWYADKIVQTI